MIVLQTRAFLRERPCFLEMNLMLVIFYLDDMLLQSKMQLMEQGIMDKIVLILFSAKFHYHVQFDSDSVSWSLSFVFIDIFLLSLCRYSED